MTKLAQLLLLFGFILVLCVPVSSAHAQATRTWISGVGDDANPCSRTAPCKTFAGAISKTSVAGEIDCLDPGGFGALTITKSITLKCDPQSNGGVLVSGTPGITVAAGSTGVVNLIGLDFDGLGSGTFGIQLTSGATLNIQNCVIYGFTSPAINITPSSGTTTVNIRDTTIMDNASGVDFKPSGGATVNAVVERTRIVQNTGGGLKADGTGGGPVNVAISDSVISLNASNGVNAASGPSGNVKIDLTRDVIALNGLAGVQSTQANGGTATVTVGSSMLSNNTTATSIVSGAALLTFQNNQVTGAAGSGFSTTIAPQ